MMDGEQVNEVEPGEEVEADEVEDETGGEVEDGDAADADDDGVQND